MSDETVKVTICATARVEYYQTVEMPKSEFDRLNNELDSDNRVKLLSACDEIEEILDLKDIYDVTNFELEDFRIVHHTKRENSNA